MHCSYGLLIVERLEVCGDCTTKEKMQVFDEGRVEYEISMED